MLEAPLVAMMPWPCVMPHRAAPLALVRMYGSMLSRVQHSAVGTHSLLKVSRPGRTGGLFKVLCSRILVQKAAVGELKAHATFDSSQDGSPLESEGQPLAQIERDQVHCQGLAGLCARATLS